MVERIEERGGLVVAKANTPEFGAGAQTFNEVFGVTRNPWNTSKTPAGSSGGSAVALTTGQVWLAQGSDLGGSLRIPAAFCGCVGMRPSPGRVANGPLSYPFTANSVEGPMGRTVADVALFLDTLSGHQRMDPISLPKPAEPFQQSVANARPPKRVAFSMDMGVSPIHPEVRAATDKAMQHFRDMGTEIVENRVEFAGVEQVFQVLRAAQFAALYQGTLKTHRDKLKPEAGSGTSRRAWRSLQVKSARPRLVGLTFIHRFERQFDDVDLFVSPTVNTPPFDASIRYLEELDGQKFDSYISWLIMTFAITVTTCPSISVPGGFTSDGLPVGIQITAPQRRDDIALAGAHMFEQAAGLTAQLPIDPREG